MVVDNSALVALLLREPEAERVLATLSRSRRSLLAAPTYLECCIVMTGKLQDRGVSLLDRLMALHRVETVAVTPDHAQAARDAFLRWGKGRHPAALNFGDCLSFAVAQVERLPLLFVGPDFSRTDIQPA